VVLWVLLATPRKFFLRKLFYRTDPPKLPNRHSFTTCVGNCSAFDLSVSASTQASVRAVYFSSPV